MESYLSLATICQWLETHQDRLRAGDALPTVKEIADRAGISRQSIYNLMRNDRSQFGDAVQTRLTRVIRQIDSELGNQKTNLLRISFRSRMPQLVVGLESVKVNGVN